MQSTRRVDNFSPKDHYTNLTLSHFNLSLKYKIHFGSRTWRERERRNTDQIIKNVRIEEASAKERKKNKRSLGP